MNVCHTVCPTCTSHLSNRRHSCWSDGSVKPGFVILLHTSSERFHVCDMGFVATWSRAYVERLHWVLFAIDFKLNVQDVMSQRRTEHLAFKWIVLAVV